MQESNWTPHSRTTRLHEWLLILLLLGLAAGARAESVYKCVEAHGGVAYQSQPCAADQQTSVIKIMAAAAYVPSPHYAVEHEAHEVAVRHTSRAAAIDRRAPVAMSYECRSSDGQVFYRHSSCPHSLSSNAKAGRGTSRSRSGSASATVASRRVTREEACERIHQAGSIGRAGHEHDEDVSTYDRNLGRDPCR
jgi:hypothetical protein